MKLALMNSFSKIILQALSIMKDGRYMWAETGFYRSQGKYDW
jgi:hypothetical protein